VPTKARKSKDLSFWDTYLSDKYVSYELGSHRGQMPDLDEFTKFSVQAADVAQSKHI